MPLPGGVIGGGSISGVTASTLRLWYGTLDDEELTEVDIPAERVVDFKLTRGYSHPATLTFTILQAEHTTPIPLGAWIVFTDDDFGGQDTPLFEGFVDDIQPVASNELGYVCLDQTAAAAESVTIMNGEHSGGSLSPRAVFNAQIESDADYAFNLLPESDCGTILKQVFNNAASELRTWRAAPVSSLTSPIVDADVESWDFIPQTKVLFQSQQIRAALDHFLRYYPQYKLLFNPGLDATHGRRWRLIDVTAAPTETITLNSFPVDGDGNRTGRWILTKGIKRNTQRRATAVIFSGPEEVLLGDVSVSGATLTEQWDGTQEGNFVIFGPGGSGTGDAGRVWQIADSTKRHLTNFLPSAITVNAKDLTIAGQPIGATSTASPTLLVTWNGTDWYIVRGITLDTNLGKVYAPSPVYQKNSDDDYLVPTDARLYFGYHATPIEARYPSSGHSGDFYDETGFEREMKLYDEGLAVLYQQFRTVTTTQRIAEYTKVAESIHKAHSGIPYTGAFVSISPYQNNPMDYAWWYLGKRVNIASVDKDGNALTTGWEAINAVVTDVEFDFTSRVTVVTLSSDMMEFSNDDPESLKEMLVSEVIFQQFTQIGISSSDLGISGFGTLGEDYEGGSIGGGLSNYGLNIPTSLNIPGGLNIPRSLDIPGLSGDF